MLKRLNFVVLALLAVTGCAAPSGVAPSSGPFRFSGTIVTMDGARLGAPVGGAELAVVDGVNTNARVTADATGHYVFDALDSGRFTVSISAPGFVSAKPVIDLYRDTEVNFALAPQ